MGLPRKRKRKYKPKQKRILKSLERIQEYKNLAQQYDGILLLDYSYDKKGLQLWQCKEGHEFTRSMKAIKEYANKNNIKLIIIPYTEEYNLSKCIDNLVGDL